MNPNQKPHPFEGPPYNFSYGMKPPFRMLVVGPSGCGKSNAVLNLVTKKEYGLADYFTTSTKKGKSKTIVIVSPTLDKDPTWSKLDIPKTQRFENWLKFKPFIQALQNWSLKGTQNGSLWLCDDIITDRNACKKNAPTELDDCFCAGRHSKISVCVFTQDYTAISTTIRKNTKYLMLFRPETIADKRAIIMRYSGIVADDDMSEDDAKAKFAKMTEYCWSKEFGFMYINLDTLPNQIWFRFEEKLFPLD